MAPLIVPPSIEGFAPTVPVMVAGSARSKYRPWQAASNADLRRVFLEGYYTVNTGRFRAACAELLDWREGRLPFQHRDDGLMGILARIPIAERHALIAYGLKAGWWTVGTEQNVDSDADYRAAIEQQWGRWA